MPKRIYLIGRHGNVQLNDETVSRRHARLLMDGATLHLKDLGSRNGTYRVCGSDLQRFTAGPVERHHVFAFGECVRTIGQIIRTAELEAAMARANPEPDIPIADDRFEATTTGSLLVPRRRLSASDIVQLLERVEDQLAEDVKLIDACTSIGITLQRYERWCREFGRTRREREHNVAVLRQENERLRQRIAALEAKLGVAGDAAPRLARTDA
ncbi:MAG: FHA domain-containing protein [Gammaproteobacteria bacterium]|nr:FHA domain-containing protein [Gammaproteobacteria bacterium]MCP5201153.1 FHA domain-containing protein [Gammaproteobacteria bacterium]